MGWRQLVEGQPERYVVLEESLAAGAPTSAHWVADRQSGPLLLRFGTEDHLMIGTDYGHGDTSSEIAALRKLKERDGMSPTVVDKILGAVGLTKGA